LKALNATEIAEKHPVNQHQLSFYLNGKILGRRSSNVYLANLMLMGKPKAKASSGSQMMMTMMMRMKLILQAMITGHLHVIIMRTIMQRGRERRSSGTVLYIMGSKTLLKTMRKIFIVEKPGFVLLKYLTVYKHRFSLQNTVY
jgi:hypothetical protein